MFNFNQEQLQRKQMMHDLCNHPKVERHEKSFWSWFHKRNKEGFLWHNSEPVNRLQQSQNCQIMELKGYESPFFSLNTSQTLLWIISDKWDIISWAKYLETILMKRGYKPRNYQWGSAEQHKTTFQRQSEPQKVFCVVRRALNFKI